MDDNLVPILVAFLTAAGGSVAGFAALRKAGAEAGKSTAEATGAIVGSAGAMVTILRDQIEQMQRDMDEDRKRLQALEDHVRAWDSWADKAFAILDRSLGLIPEDQRAGLQVEVQKVRTSRPAHHRKHLVRREDPTDGGKPQP
jgi:hypothetical protein